MSWPEAFLCSVLAICGTAVVLRWIKFLGGM